MRSIVLASLLLAAASPVTAVANPERSLGVIDRLPGEDLPCDEVNRLYERTANSSRCTIYVKEWRPDGTAVPYLEDWLSPTNETLDYGYDGKAGISRRPLRLTVLNGEPLLRSCIFLGSVQSIYGEARHYAAEWQRREWKAHAEIWTSVETGKFLQVSRDFSGQRSPFPFARSVDVYAYPGDKGPDPISQTAVIPTAARYRPSSSEPAP